MRLDAVIVLLAATAPALAGGTPQTWNFDETTTGADVLWTSATAVDPAAPVFEASYQVTLVEAGVSFQNIDFGDFDVTDQIPPDFQSGASCGPGPAPATFFAESIDFPGAPEPTAVAATLTIGLDAGGFGQVQATDVVLGTLDVDLGFPFGVQTVTITSLRIAGSVTVTPSLCPTDTNADGATDVGDLVNVILDWGTDGALDGTDVDCSGFVDVGDLVEVILAWGGC